MAIGTDKENEIITLRAMGKSYSAIAQEASVAKQTAVDICRKYKERVATLKALELETLYEEQGITSTQRITAHASLLARIRDEIASRPLSDIPTDKLIELYLKQSAALKEEMIEPTAKSTDEQRRDREERAFLDGLTA